MICKAAYVGGYRHGQPCPYQSSEVIATADYTMRVCGYHARAFAPSVRYPLTFNLARIRAWRLDNLDRLVGR